MRNDEGVERLAVRFAFFCGIEVGSLYWSQPLHVVMGPALSVSENVAALAVILERVGSSVWSAPRRAAGRRRI